METQDSTDIPEKQVAQDKRQPFKASNRKNYVKKKAATEEVDFKALTHEQLLVEAERLQNHVVQLKNLLDKATCAKSNDSSVVDDGKKKKYKERPFDFNKYNKRHVFLKFAYLGWNYQGYTVQEGINNTVEHELFEAFQRTKLIEKRETSNYHRCGRTDKGVSAFTQVVSIDFRSNCSSGKGVIINPNSASFYYQIAFGSPLSIRSEINYVKLLNGVLPNDIRAIAWCPVDAELSARFDCVSRTYRYFFPKGDLDLDAMREAGKKLVGEHDYRNFCKMDVGNGVVTFFRRIDNISLRLLEKEPNMYSMVELIVEGSSFLWHQIRCIVAILLLIGENKEAPTIIDELLDVEKYPNKPQYTMCSEIPLVLFECEYNDVEWIYDRHELEKVIKHFQDEWLNHQTRSTVVMQMIESLDAKLITIDEKQEEKTQATNQRTLKQPYKSLQGKSQSLNYVKFADRQTAKSLESRVEHYVNKRKLDADVYEKINEAKEIGQTLKMTKLTQHSISNKSD